MLAGPEKSGKSALAKQLMLRLRAEGYLPVLLDGSELARKSGRNTDLRSLLSSKLNEQYNSLTIDSYLQNGHPKRVIIVDDFEKVYEQGISASEAADLLATQCDHLAVLCSEELIVCESRGGLAEFSGLPGFKKMQICELGQLRVENISRRWITANSNVGLSPKERDTRAKEISATLRSVLSADVIPHHPWIVLVLIHQSEQTDTLAVRSGSYGHLYQAILTTALSQSRKGALDLNGKFSYLSCLAYEFYEQSAAQMQDKEARGFHKRYCDDFDIALDFESTIEGLIETGVLRKDTSGYSFAAKYSFCFFLAWYIRDHLSEKDQQELVDTLCSQLYHTESANTLLFLCHLASDKFVLDAILSRSAGIFGDAPLATIIDDVLPLARLDAPENISIPDGNPEANRRAAIDNADASRQLEHDSSSFDGRNVTTTPSESIDAVTEIVREVQSAFKMVQILGQILRNGTTSINASTKKSIVEEVFRLSRRMLGKAFEDLAGELDDWRDNTRKRIEEITKARKQDLSANAIAIRADKEIVGVCWLACFTVTKSVAEAVGARLLSRTYERVVTEDPAVPNRLFALTISMDHDREFPIKQAETIYREVQNNWFAQSLVRSLVAHHFYLYKEPHNIQQKVCDKLKIGLPKRVIADQRRGKALSGPHFTGNPKALRKPSR